MPRKPKIEPLVLLDYIDRNPPRSQREIAADFGVKQATIRRTLRKLINGFKTAYIKDPEGKHRSLEITDDGRVALAEWRNKNSAPGAE